MAKFRIAIELLAAFVVLLGGFMLGEESTAGNMSGPSLSALVFREILNHEKTGCKLVQVEGTGSEGIMTPASKKGDWVLTFSCPDGKSKSSVFTTAGNLK